MLKISDSVPKGISRMLWRFQFMFRKTMIVFSILIVTATLLSQSRVDSLRSSIADYEQRGESGSEYLKTLNDLAKELLYSAPDECIELGEKALKGARNIGDRENEGMALLMIGNSNLMMGQFEKARDEYFCKSYKIGKDVDSKLLISSSLNSLASVAMSMGDYDQALETFLQSIEIEKERGDTIRVATIQFNVAGLLMNRGQYETALGYFLNSIRVFENTGQTELVKRGMNNVAVLYHAWGNWDKALEYYEKSAQMYKETGDSLGMSIPLNNIGEIYKDQGKYQQAIEYYSESLRLGKESDNMHFQGVANIGLGEAYLRLEKFPQALKHLNDALEIFEQISFQEGEARVYKHLAEIDYHKKNFPRAQSYVERSLKLAGEAGIKDLIQDDYKLLSEIYEGKSDHQNALTYFTKYSALRDSLFNEEKSKKIAEMNVKYETEKKDKENLLLRKNNEIKELELKRRRTQQTYAYALALLILLLAFVLYRRYRQKQKVNLMLQEKNEHISRQRDQLSAALNELKETQKQLIESEKMASLGSLVTGVAHEINTPVGIGVTAASALKDKTVNLARNYQDNTMKRTELEGYLKTAYESANLILKNLQRTGDLVQSFKQVSIDQSTEQMREFGLKAYLEDLLFSVGPRMKEKNVQVAIDIPEDLSIISYPGAFASIFTNLMVNSVIHGFKDIDGGKIEMDATREDDHVFIRYRDNGRGIPKDILPKIFDPFFTTNKQLGTGLGLHIVYNQVVQKLHGEILCESELDSGVTFMIKIPVKIGEIE